jgi:hypothetical protein
MAKTVPSRPLGSSMARGAGTMVRVTGLLRGVVVASMKHMEPRHSDP